MGGHTLSLLCYHKSDSLQPPFTNWIASVCYVLIRCLKSAWVTCSQCNYFFYSVLINMLSNQISNFNSYTVNSIQVLKMIESDSIIQEQCTYCIFSQISHSNVKTQQPMATMGESHRLKLCQRQPGGHEGLNPGVYNRAEDPRTCVTCPVITHLGQRTDLSQHLQPPFMELAQRLCRLYVE